MYPRICNLSKSNSFFLFGPRGSGKTWYLREFFNQAEDDVTYLNLLDEKIYLDLLADPSRLYNYLKKGAPALQWIVIDEVQRIPSLLNTVHQILEDPQYYGKVRFALTGSSARKLKRGGANLLAGRAFLYNLYPLSIFETKGSWELSQALNWGSLPKIVTAESDETREEFLYAYVNTYLKEELREEQIVRKIEPFGRFLEAAAQANGTIVQYSNIARASKVDEKSVARYFEILEDTLLGFFLEPFSNSARERTVSKSKFYFFDPGITRVVSHSLSAPLQPGTYAWGKAFEHLFILECIKLNSYKRLRAKFSYLRTKDDAEIDLIIEKPGSGPICLEIKSGSSVETTQVKRFKTISSSIKNSSPIMIYGGQQEQCIEDVRVLPWEQGLREIFGE